MRVTLLSIWLAFVLCAPVSVFAKFNFAGKDSRLRIKDPRAKFVLNTSILDFQGTLEINDFVTDQLVGQPIIFSSGIVERNGASASWTGRFDASTHGRVMLQGSSQMRAQPGMLFDGLHVSGQDNLVEGTPKFSSPIVLAGSDSELKFSIQNKLNHNVHMNGGKIKLEDTLSIGDDVMFFGSGAVDINNHTLNFPGKASTWGGSLYFLSATDMTLNAQLTLTGQWYFGPDGSVGVLQGNGNVLDLSSGGSLIVQAGVGLGVTDVVIKGLSETQGTIVMCDQNSTLSLSNVVLQLSGSYSFTQGKLYFYGANSMIVTGSNILTIGGTAVARIDGTTLEYDTLSFPDMKNIVPITPEGARLISVNSGRLMSRPSGTSCGSVLYVDKPFYQQLSNESFDGTNRKLNFRGSNAANNLTWDGGGNVIQFPSGAAQSGTLTIAADQTVTLQNVVLRNFSSAAVAINSGASLIFGDGVTIQLGSIELLSSKWTFTGQTTPSWIMGNTLDMTSGGTLRVGSGATVNLSDVHVRGISQTNGTLLCYDVPATINFSGVTFELSGDYTFTLGNIKFNRRPSLIIAKGNTFTMGGVWGAQCGLLTIDGVTVEYDQLDNSSKTNRAVFSPVTANVTAGGGVWQLNNGGRLMRKGDGYRWLYNYFVDSPFYSQVQPEAFDGTNRVLCFRGSSASNMTWDGGGYPITFPYGAALAGSITVLPNKTVTLQNVILKNFSSAAVTLYSGASLVFGNGVVIELGAHESLSSTWSFTGQSTASTIRGNGKNLDLSTLTGGNRVGISVGPGTGVSTGVTLNIEDVHLLGLSGGPALDTLVSTANTYSTAAAYIASSNRLRCVDYRGIINLRNTDINLSGNYTLTAGNINIFNDVSVVGRGYTFAFSSNGTLAIKSASKLLFDRNVTFSYDSSGLGARGPAASKTQLTMADQTSCLYLNGCTLYGTGTSPKLRTGVVVINDKVRIQSEGIVDAEAITFDTTSGLLVEVLAGATMDVYGAIAHV